MAVTEYEARTLQARLSMLELVESQLNALDTILEETYFEIDALIGNLTGTDGKLRANDLARLQASIADRMDLAFDQINDSMADHMRRAIELARDGNLDGAMAMFEEIDARFGGQLPGLFQPIPDAAMRSILSRMLDDGKLFSDRIWDLEQFSNNELSKILSKGVLEGKSHTELMKDLEPYLRMTDDEFAAFQRTWNETHDDVWKAEWKTRGRLKYNLHRLSRTEINNAHREGQIHSARLSPWVQGLKWNLSASHPKPDICDEWATQDLYGLGKGVYPFDEVPLDHPNGLCFLTNVLASQEEIERLIRARA